MFDLHFDARSYRSEGVTICNNIYSAILSFGCDKRRIIAHATKQCGDEFLKFVCVFVIDLLFETLNCQLLNFVNRSLLPLLPFFTNILVFHHFSGLVLIFPIPICGCSCVQQTNFTKLDRVFTFWCQIPNTFLLYKIPRFDAIYAEEV